MRVNDIVKVTNLHSPYYTYVGAVVGIKFGFPYNDVTVAFGVPISNSIMFSEDELTLFLESSNEDSFCVGDEVEIIDKTRTSFGRRGTVTKTQHDDNIVFVLVEGEDVPIWFFDHQVDKIANLLP